MNNGNEDYVIASNEKVSAVSSSDLNASVTDKLPNVGRNIRILEIVRQEQCVTVKMANIITK